MISPQAIRLLMKVTMKRLFNKLQIFFRLIKGIDWEYTVPMLFIYMKYREETARRNALKFLKLAYFERRFSHLLSEYKKKTFVNHCNDGPIWICWLQGTSSMPPVVKTCYKRLKEMAPPSREVILLTWKNLEHYAFIPDYIIEKVRKGIMSYIHFSDIIRFSVLAEHGGLWVDSTVYVSSPIDQSVFEHTYFSVRTEYDTESEYKYNGINRCQWKCFILGGAAHSAWYSCARDMIFEYWRNNNFFMDYLIIDYILLTIYDSIGSVRREVDAGIEIAQHIFLLEKIANCPFDEKKYKEICKGCRWFKLSYKIPFREETEDSQLTYFGNIMRKQSI